MAVRAAGTVARLRELSGRCIYQRNAFRVTGLPATADRRAVRQRQQQLSAIVSVGGQLPGGVSGDEVRTAFGCLDDPRQRLVDELFWTWGAPDDRCGCNAGAHERHDEAVNAHHAAVEQELVGRTDDRLWRDGASRWATVLDHPTLWAHLDSRVADLDDPRLGAGSVEALQRGARAALAASAVELAAEADDPSRLIAHAHRWGLPEPEVDDLVEAVAAPLLADVAARVEEAGQALDAGDHHRAASVVLEVVVPRLRRIDALAPPARFRACARCHDDAAVILHACATREVDLRGVTAGQAALSWLVTAIELAVSSATSASLREDHLAFLSMSAEVRRLWVRVRQAAATGAARRLSRVLRGMRAQLAGTPLAVDVDSMVAFLEGRPAPQPVTTPRPPRPPRRRLRLSPRGSSLMLGAARLAGRMALGGAVGAVIWIVLSYLGVLGPSSVTVVAERIADNPPVGACIATREEWGSGWIAAGDACTGQHWGVILGYPPLGPSPSPFPGDDQAAALAAFRCGQLLEARHLDPGYAVAKAKVLAASWNAGGAAPTDFENYVTCVVHRSDDALMPPGKLGGLPTPVAASTPVPMSLSSVLIAGSAPVGTCVATPIEPADPADEVDVVECSAPHWAEVLDYAVLYRAGEPWPGDATVKAAAAAACEQTLAGHAAGPDDHAYTRYPAQAWWASPAPVIYAPCLRVEGG